ncbi:activating signal cointegrator 1 complex subunit, partial [Stylosanthes scabra]|nr:activating signal cointegrator 1 complex subunit [Stylosanthes scabra]
MLIQIPRFTNSLRSPFDVDQAYLHRKTLLLNQNPRNSANSLDESELARKIVVGWEQASYEVRQAYKQFIGAVVVLTDGEMRSEEFHEVVLAVYRHFGRPMEDEDYIDRIIADKKLELQKLVGHAIADTKLRHVASLAQKLLNLQPSNESPSLSLERNLDDNEDLEFGADFVFQAPTRFLVDVSFDNVDMMDFRNSVPVSFNEEQYGLTIPTDQAIDAEKFNLTWVREACDKIARNSNSQISRDELAMTICRVLNSEKPGEEIAGDLLDLVGDSAFETVQNLLL